MTVSYYVEYSRKLVGGRRINLRNIMSGKELAEYLTNYSERYQYEIKSVTVSTPEQRREFKKYEEKEATMDKETARQIAKKFSDDGKRRDAERMLDLAKSRMPVAFHPTLSIEPDTFRVISRVEDATLEIRYDEDDDRVFWVWHRSNPKDDQYKTVSGDVYVDLLLKALDPNYEDDDEGDYDV